MAKMANKENINMNIYNNCKVKSSDIVDLGFKPICNSKLFDKSQLSKIRDFVNKYSVDDTIFLNDNITDDDIDDCEYDYEVYGGHIRINCNSAEEGQNLSNLFQELTYMRCECLGYYNKTALIYFESE